MTLSRKLSSDAANQVSGFRIGPTEEMEAQDLAIISDEWAPIERGHEDLGQVIRKGMELRTRSLTCVQDAAIKPGEFSAYVVRADGSASISLSKPPAVPIPQLSYLGNARRRVWVVDLLIYSAIDSAVSWPTEVRWGRVGYAMTGDPATLTESAGPPANPRPAGTADRIRLTYWEMTGEWWAEPVALAVVSMDPDGLLEDPTEPETPTNPDEDKPGDPGTALPEDGYTDPATGDPITSVVADPKEGSLLALHAGAISYSTDCGSTWRILSNTPPALISLSAIQDQGAAVSAIGGTYVSPNLATWTKLDFSAEVLTSIELENGDFEDGLTGWTVLSGDPVALDTTQPAQQPGSAHYVTCEQDGWFSSGGGAFSLSKSVSLSSLANMRASVDVFVAEEGASGEIEIFSSVGDYQSFNSLNFDSDVQNKGYIIEGEWMQIGGAFVDPEFGPLDMRWTAHDHTGSAYSQTGYGDGFLRVFRINGFASGHGVWYKVKALDAGSVARPMSCRFVVSGVTLAGACNIGLAQAPGVSIQPTNETTATHAVISHEGQLADRYTTTGGPGEYLIEIDNAAEFDLFLSYNNDTSGNSFYLTDQSAESAVSSTSLGAEALAVGKWHRISVDLDDLGSTDFDIRLHGKGSPANVYFDNLRLETVEARDESSRSVVRDLLRRRHVAFTASSIYEIKDGASTYLSAAPIDANLAAVRGSAIIISDGANSIRFSNNGGDTWTEISTTSPVRQVFVEPRILAVLEDGRVLEVSAEGEVVLSSVSAGGRIAFDARRKMWFSVDTAGGVKMSRDLNIWELDIAQPARGDRPPATRRIVATDIGRHLGFVEGWKDLYSRDAAPTWSLNNSLTQDIVDIAEIK